MTYSVLDSIQKQDQNKLREEFALDVLMGLSSSEKNLPSRYLYDNQGSDLFSQICDQPEYYPTNKESEIFLKHQDEIYDKFKGGPFNLIELGAGDGRKTEILLNKLLQCECDFSYIPVDISEFAMKELTNKLATKFPKLKVQGIVGDYFDALDNIQFDSNRRNIVFFLGSNVGNFSKSGAIGFLRKIWNYLQNDDYLFSGFDLKKDLSVLNKAYNDEKGITKAFNLNLLERINRELGGEFKPDLFYHYGFYNPNLGAMESHLISKKAQDILISDIGKRFHFEPYEPIHLEYSYKHHKKDILNLANDTGYKIETEFFDDQEYFVDSLWKVDKHQ